LRRRAEKAEQVPAATAGSTDGAADGAEAADARTAPEAGSATPGSLAGPVDVDDLAEDDPTPRIDLGAILIAPVAGRDLRVQVDENTGAVRAVLLADKDGAVELRAFAAPRNGDLWEEVRPQIAADTARRGGTATEREGRFGTELICEVQVQRPDGAHGTQTSRVVGVNGPRWLLRATFLGEPARNAEVAADWDAAIAGVAVRRGAHAMPAGEQLPLTLPEGLQRVDDAT